MELQTDLGPKFAFPDVQSGNLRSKYGRLQKVNEVAGYVPSNVFRMKKSPQKSPVHENSKRTVNSESTEIVPETSAHEKSSPRVNQSFEAMDTDSPRVVIETYTAPEPQKPKEIARVEEKRTKTIETNFTPPAMNTSRRISIRRQSMAIPHVPSPPRPPPKGYVEPVEPMFQLPKEIKDGIYMSPTIINHERFISLPKLQPGNIIWGLLAKYPPWPCMVSYDPKGIYLKQSEWQLTKCVVHEFNYCFFLFLPSVEGKKIQFQLHVRFFGPKGLNGWISPRRDYLLFDADNITDELRHGDLGKMLMSPKMSAELNWAIEDAQIVASEPELLKRGDVFQSIVEEQFV